RRFNDRAKVDLEDAVAVRRFSHQHGSERSRGGCGGGVEAPQNVACSLTFPFARCSGFESCESPANPHLADPLHNHAFGASEQAIEDADLQVMGYPDHAPWLRRWRAEAHAGPPA